MLYAEKAGIVSQPQGLTKKAIITNVFLPRVWSDIVAEEDQDQAHANQGRGAERVGINAAGEDNTPTRESLYLGCPITEKPNLTVEVCPHCRLTGCLVVLKASWEGATTDPAHHSSWNSGC